MYTLFMPFFLSPRILSFIFNSSGCDFTINLEKIYFGLIFQHYQHLPYHQCYGDISDTLMHFHCRNYVPKSVLWWIYSLQRSSCLDGGTLRVLFSLYAEDDIQAQKNVTQSKFYIVQGYQHGCLSHTYVNKL